jgi:hypothetical protein
LKYVLPNRTTLWDEEVPYSETVRSAMRIGLAHVALMGSVLIYVGPLQWMTNPIGVVHDANCEVAIQAREEMIFEATGGQAIPTEVVDLPNPSKTKRRRKPKKDH